MAQVDADVWFRFNAENVSSAGADLLRLKEAALAAGFDLRGAKVTVAAPGDSTPGWAQKSDGWTHYVPQDSDVEL